MDRATQLYEQAIVCLQRADETAGAEVRAEKLLRQAADELLPPETKDENGNKTVLGAAMMKKSFFWPKYTLC